MCSISCVAEPQTPLGDCSGLRAIGRESPMCASSPPFLSRAALGTCQGFDGCGIPTLGHQWIKQWFIDILSPIHGAASVKRSVHSFVVCVALTFFCCVCGPDYPSRTMVPRTRRSLSPRGEEQVLMDEIRARCFDTIWSVTFIQRSSQHELLLSDKEDAMKKMMQIGVRSMSRWFKVKKLSG